MQQESKVAPSQGAPLPPNHDNAAVAYIIQQETAQPAVAKYDRLEAWGPSLLTLVGALIGVTIPLVVKWIADKRERRLALKRDIYLKVADAVTEAGEAMGLLVSMDAPINDSMRKFSGALGAISKAEVVASMPLVRALARLERTTATFIGQLIGMRAEMEKAQGRIQINDKYIAKIQGQIDNNLAEQTQINLNGGPYDDGRFDRLQKNFDFLQGQQSDYFAKNDADYAVRQKTIGAMASRVMDMRRHISPLQADVLSLIRKELDFMPGFDKEEYLAIKGESVEVAEKFVHDLQNDLEQAYKRDGDDRKDEAGK